MSRRARARRGVALVIVLVVLAIMTVAVGSFLYQTRLEINMVQAQMEATQAFYLARSGVWRAICLLRDDLLKDRDVLEDDNLIEIDDKEKGILYDAYAEPWGSDAELLQDVRLDDGPRRRSRDDTDRQATFSVRVFDESGKININAREVSLRALIHLLELSGLEDEERAAGVALGIIDYRDTDDEVNLEQLEERQINLREYGDPASEATFYNPEIDPRELEVSEEWVPLKNDVFDTMEELLLVRGMDYFLLFGEDANRNGELDDNEQDGDVNPPFDNGDKILFRGIADWVTVYSYAKTNLNTAPQEVIEALLFEHLDKKAAEAAEKIAKQRNGRDRILGTKDDVPFMTWSPGEGGEGKAVEDLDLEPDVLNQLKNVFDLRSDSFRIVSTGRVGDTERQISVLVSRQFYTEEELLDLYAYLFDDLGEEAPEVDSLEPKQREQVKFTIWEWNDYSLVDARFESS